MMKNNHDNIVSSDHDNVIYNDDSLINELFSICVVFNPFGSHSTVRSTGPATSMHVGHFTRSRQITEQNYNLKCCSFFVVCLLPWHLKF